jgi:4-hydroxyphenylpyruvate dioxygenase
VSDETSTVTAARGPRTGIATVCLSGTLEDKLAAAAAAGFDGVEVFENDLIASPLSPAQVRRSCADLGLTIDLYQPFRDFEAVPRDVLAANLRRAERKFDLMEQLGADLVLVCSSVSPDAVDDDDLAAAQLRLLAERAAEHGVRVAYEALAWGRFVNTVDHSWEVVRRADHPALGLCVDSFHVLSRGSDPALVERVAAEKLFFLQLADAPRLSADVLQWSRHHRLFPGQGDFDLPAFLGHVLAAGYTGPLSLEVFNDVFRQSDPARAAVDAMRSLRALREAVAARGPARAREALRGPGVPPAPELGGHAFTEVVVGAEAAPRVRAALAALGFAHTGQHRSKPVQLWAQGAARVLVNSTAPEAGVAEVGALAVDSADPGRSARRAEALLAPVLPREHRAGEADLAAVAAPDGTSMFFCRTGADGWLADFVPTGARGGTAITGTDHVSLTQPFDHFDEAALFYRSVLGLAPEPVAEVAAPFGLMRSRTVGGGGVRFVLSAALLRRGDWAPAVPAPQHVAFTSDDVIGCARAAGAAGAPLLAVPDNYYDDLDARFALDPALLAAMRECGVLYDRDADGEYLHLCTEVLGSRVFFEVVQRIGGYGGTGAVNAPVGMAAHRRGRRARDGG